MANELILFDQKFKIQRNSILNYLYSNSESKKQSDLELFIYSFTELYRLPIFVPLLNAMVTKLKHKEAIFKITPHMSWDRVLGHCASAPKEIKSQESSFKRGLFSRFYTIMIKKIVPSIIIHEIAHAMERVAEINLKDGFIQALEEDFKTENTNSLQLKAGVRDVMEKQLKNYDLQDHNPELFARFFEMLSMSYDVDGWGRYQYLYNEIENYFANTVAWTWNVLIPILENKTDDDVKKSAIMLVDKLEPYKKSWVKKHPSKFADVSDENKKWVESLKEEEKYVLDPEEVNKAFEGKEIKKLDNGVEYIEFNKENFK